MIDVEALIQAAPPGTMVYARFRPEGGKWETGLLIREESARIRRLGRNPVVEVRAGLFREGSVWLLAILLKAAGELYETWFNYCQPDGGEECLMDWTRQKTLAIIFYGDRGRERAISIRNPLADIARQALPVLRQAEPWGMAEFDAVRERLYARYPTVRALWDALAVR